LEGNDETNRARRATPRHIATCVPNEGKQRENGVGELKPPGLKSLASGASNSARPARYNGFAKESAVSAARACRFGRWPTTAGELQSHTRRGQVHVFGRRLRLKAERSRRKMDQTPDFAILLPTTVYATRYTTRDRRKSRRRLPMLLVMSIFPACLQLRQPIHLTCEGGHTNPTIYRGCEEMGSVAPQCQRGACRHFFTTF
jgi:hypothetical protein